ncbi:MAG: hypothetical protein JOS17DRAFT_727010 [Linnemannia elongata]|nr:MAG: hypothetical protein JOS17DRAFT_727010 [Linnemannia elongata]
MITSYIAAKIHIGLTEGEQQHRKLSSFFSLIFFYRRIGRWRVSSGISGNCNSPGTFQAIASVRKKGRFEECQMLFNAVKLFYFDGTPKHPAQIVVTDDRIRCLDTFTDQIKFLHQNQAQLLHRLNRTSSYDDESRHSLQQQQGVIMMDPQYHRDFVELFYQIQDEVPKIDGHLKALLGWNQQQQQDSSLVGRTSSSASSTLTSRSQNDSTLDRLVCSIFVSLFLSCVRVFFLLLFSSGLHLFIFSPRPLSVFAFQKTSLDGLTSLSQQQLEILEASSKLQANLIKVLQSSSSSSSTLKHTMK